MVAEEKRMPLQPEVKSLLSRPNFAHLATLMPDGSPNVTPVWFGLDGDHLLVSTSDGSLKARNLRRDPRVGLSVIDFHDPYEEVQIRGRVIEIRPDTNFQAIDANSHKYIGAAFPMRNASQIVMVIEVEKARYTKLPFKHTPPAGH